MDAERCQLIMERFRDTLHRELRRAVNAPFGRCSVTSERRDIYDVAGPLLTHRWQHDPNHVQQSEDIGPIDALDLFCSGFFNSTK
jgi:hypothetical protein